MSRLSASSLRCDTPRSLWCNQRIYVTITSPEGSGAAENSELEIDRPYAIVGSHPQADIPIKSPGVPKRAFYFHATSAGLFCRPLEHASPDWGEARYLSPQEPIEIAGWRLQVRTESNDTPTGQEEHKRVPVLGIYRQDMKPHKRRLFESLQVIGRSSSCDIHLRGASVSACHTVLYWQGDRLWCIDLLSGNGTFLKEEKIDCGEITLGDQLHVGKYHLVFYRYSNRVPDPSALANEPTVTVAACDAVAEQINAEPVEEFSAFSTEVLESPASTEEAYVQPLDEGIPDQHVNEENEMEVDTMEAIAMEDSVLEDRVMEEHAVEEIEDSIIEEIIDFPPPKNKSQENSTVETALPVAISLETDRAEIAELRSAVVQITQTLTEGQASFARERVAFQSHTAELNEGFLRFSLQLQEQAALLVAEREKLAAALAESARERASFQEQWRAVNEEVAHLQATITELQAAAMLAENEGSDSKEELFTPRIARELEQDEELPGCQEAPRELTATMVNAARRREPEPLPPAGMLLMPVASMRMVQGGEGGIITTASLPPSRLLAGLVPAAPKRLAGNVVEALGKSEIEIPLLANNTEPLTDEANAGPPIVRTNASQDPKLLHFVSDRLGEMESNKRFGAIMLWLIAFLLTIGLLIGASMFWKWLDTPVTR